MTRLCFVKFNQIGGRPHHPDLFVCLAVMLMSCADDSKMLTDHSVVTDIDVIDGAQVPDALRPDGQPSQTLDMDIAIDVSLSQEDQFVVDAAPTLRQAFSEPEADARIEMDCSGCHEAGGTGSSRRLGWNNMSYQLVYLSVKDPWTASGSRMSLQGDYWSEEDIERLRLLVVSLADE